MGAQAGDPYSSHAMQVCCLRSGSLLLEIGRVVQMARSRALALRRASRMPGSRFGSCDHRFVDELWVGDNRELAVDKTHERLAVRGPNGHPTHLRAITIRLDETRSTVSSLDSAPPSEINEFFYLQVSTSSTWRSAISFGSSQHCKGSTRQTNPAYHRQRWVLTQPAPLENTNR